MLLRPMAPDRIQNQPFTESLGLQEEHESARRLCDESFLRGYLGPNLHQITASLVRRLDLPVVLHGLFFRPWWELLVRDAEDRRRQLLRYVQPIKVRVLGTRQPWGALVAWHEDARLLLVDVHAEGGGGDCSYSGLHRPLMAPPMDGEDERLYVMRDPYTCAYVYVEPADGVCLCTQHSSSLSYLFMQPAAAKRSVTINKNSTQRIYSFVVLLLVRS